jgi:hypothetical protein
MIATGIMRWAVYVALVRDMINAYNIIVGKLEGKGQNGRPELGTG